MDLRHLATGYLRATVEFSLDGEAMKGRVGYKSGIRPNHWMPGRDYTFFGKLDFVNQEWLQPGETCVADGRFVIAEQDQERFVPGFSWQVGEAATIVGRCTLLTIEHPYERIAGGYDSGDRWESDDPGR